MSLYWAIWGMAVALVLGLSLGGWSERRRARSRALMEAMRRANDLSRIGRDAERRRSADS